VPLVCVTGGNAGNKVEVSGEETRVLCSVGPEESQVRRLDLGQL
jgi:hypothetical protein